MSTFFALLEDYLRFWPYAAAGVAGVALAVADRGMFGRPVAAILLVLAIVGGVVVMQMNPFTFESGERYFQGMIVASMAACALAGYAIAFVTMKISGGARS